MRARLHGAKMSDLPTGQHTQLVPFTPTARRELRVFGAPVELVLVPERRRRTGVVSADRPALAPSPAERILAEETLWHDSDHAITPNRYPFAAGQRILWRREPGREPTRAFWLLAHRLLDTPEPTAVLLNNIGSAATIPRAHAHVLAEVLPFLAGLGERAVDSPPCRLPTAATLVQKNVPFCLLGVRGPAEARADALVALAEVRLTATWNVVAERDATWIVPRALETPAPHFVQALGAAEFWGRWCFVDEAEFESASAARLERALQLSALPPLGDG